LILPSLVFGRPLKLVRFFYFLLPLLLVFFFLSLTLLHLSPTLKLPLARYKKLSVSYGVDRYQCLAALLYPLRPSFLNQSSIFRLNYARPPLAREKNVSPTSRRSHRFTSFLASPLSATPPLPCI